MKLSPDQTIFWQHGFININLTIVTTWVIMLLLSVASGLITRKLKTGIHISRWQCILEMIVTTINNEIKEAGLDNPQQYTGFIGTLFLFIATANICIILPWYEAPTGSLSTTAALALCVFFAVPFFGIEKKGMHNYMKSSHTLALAVRLFGNIMSGGMIVAILLSIAPLLFPIVMKALGLLTGIVQAYIFSILATVYIASVVQKVKQKEKLFQ
jgi:F-type H+-transporting ATPase subunit a